MNSVLHDFLLSVDPLVTPMATDPQRYLPSTRSREQLLPSGGSVKFNIGASLAHTALPCHAVLGEHVFRISIAVRRSSSYLVKDRFSRSESQN